MYDSRGCDGHIEF